MSPQTKGEDLNSLVDQRGESGRFMGGEDKIYQKAVQNKKRKLEKKQERKIISTVSHCNLDHNVNNLEERVLKKNLKMKSTIEKLLIEGTRKSTLCPNLVRYR